MFIARIKTWRMRNEEGIPTICFDAWKTGILCIKKSISTEISPMFFTFFFVLSTDSLSLNTDPSEKDLGNMSSLWFLKAGDLPALPCV